MAQRTRLGLLGAVPLPPQFVVHVRAGHAAPGCDQHIARRSVQLLHGRDAAGCQSSLHAWTNAVDGRDRQRVQALGNFMRLDHRQTVRFVHVAGQLGQQPVRRNAHRGAHAFAHLGQQCGLDLLRQPHGTLALAPASGQLAFHLVDAHHLQHRHDAVHHRQGLLVYLHIPGMVGQDQHDVRTAALCVRHPRARLDAKGLGLVAGRNAARGIGHHRHHAHRSPAQGRVELLLDRGEVAVEVDKQAAEHGSNIL